MSKDFIKLADFIEFVAGISDEGNFQIQRNEKAKM